MFISQYIYQSLHVSGDYVPIIKRNSCVYVTLHPTLHTGQSSTQNNKYQVSHNTVSPDDWHIVARNM